VAATPPCDGAHERLTNQRLVARESTEERMKSASYVLVHGAWHGGWCWSRVAERLRAAGHRVFTPTCTGLGERAHLMRRDITLDTFTDDIANVIEAEELSDVILVGHSFGGLPISGVAERMRARIRHLVYLDALLVEPGQCVFDMLTPEVVAKRRAAAQESSGGLSLPPQPAQTFGVTHEADIAWLERRLTPHPLATYASPLNVSNPIGNDLPRTYIACTDPPYVFLDPVKAWVRRQEGWRVLTMATGHDAMITAPDELAQILGEIAQS
jgi:pimeloyl-ACP methyl ester carboxylesterase